ncbi:MAG: hypothetical protein IPM33_09130 [Phycisphaerales bacterium]|nr:hypothetical protein [Phycisphaerales bacterium]
MHPAASCRPPMEGSMSDQSQRDQQPVFTADRRIIALKRRLVREATTAIAMLEKAISALWTLDVTAAGEVRREDDRVDSEEVAIEQETLEILALHHPFARDFRALAFIIKVNGDIERSADHACSIAKVTMRIAEHRPGQGPPKWPTSLRELGERVPVICHELVRCVLDEDIEGARRLALADKVIDQLDKRLFAEAIELGTGGDANAVALSMHIARVGRELERVGDLQVNIAEELVYLGTGQIVRHQKLHAEAPSKSPSAR